MEVEELEKQLDAIREEWNKVKRNRDDSFKKMECRARMESLELALKQAQRSSGSIEVKKELLDQAIIPLEYQGDAGSTAEKALDIDNIYQLPGEQVRRSKRSAVAARIKGKNLPAPNDSYLSGPSTTGVPAEDIVPRNPPGLPDAGILQPLRLAQTQHHATPDPAIQNMEQVQSSAPGTPNPPIAMQTNLRLDTSTFSPQSGDVVSQNPTPQVAATGAALVSVPLLIRLQTHTVPAPATQEVEQVPLIEPNHTGAPQNFKPQLEAATPIALQGTQTEALETVASTPRSEDIVTPQLGATAAPPTSIPLEQEVAARTSFAPQGTQAKAQEAVVWTPRSGDTVTPQLGATAVPPTSIPLEQEVAARTSFAPQGTQAEAQEAVVLTPWSGDTITPQLGATAAPPTSIPLQLAVAAHTSTAPQGAQAKAIETVVVTTRLEDAAIPQLDAAAAPTSISPHRPTPETQIIVQVPLSATSNHTVALPALTPQLAATTLSPSIAPQGMQMQPLLTPMLSPHFEDATRHSLTLQLAEALSPNLPHSMQTPAAQTITQIPPGALAHSDTSQSFTSQSATGVPIPIPPHGLPPLSSYYVPEYDFSGSSHIIYPAMDINTLDMLSFSVQESGEVEPFTEGMAWHSDSNMDLIYSTEKEALRAFTAELDALLSTISLGTDSEPYTFRLTDIKPWKDVQLPMLEQKLCDSDRENRMRHDLYSAEAASKYHTAYYNLLSSKKDALQESIGKGMGAGPMFMQYLEAWERCKSDTNELHLRAEAAKKSMQIARHEMEQYLAKQTKVTLQFKLQELDNKLWHSQADLSQGDVFTLRNRIMEVRSALKALEDQEVHATSDNHVEGASDDIRDKRTSDDLRDHSEGDTAKPPKKRSKTASKLTAKSTTKSDSASKSKRTQRKKAEEHLDNEENKVVKPTVKSTAKSTAKSKGKRKASEGDSDSDDDKSSIPYENLDEEGQREYEEGALKALRYYATVSSRRDVSQDELSKAKSVFTYKYRRAARNICEFLPESATTSYEVAIIVFWTSKGNLVCRYHEVHRNVDHHDSPEAFHGVAYLKELNTNATDNPQIVPKPLHMHCGCLIEHVLFDFLFWKTLSARSSRPQLNEQLWNIGKESTPPYFRAFWVSQFKATTNLTLDDLYALGPDATGRHFSMMARMILKTVQTLSTQLNLGVSLSFESEEDKEQFKQLAHI